MQRAFEICFAAVVMVFGGVSRLTHQKLYRFLVKPRFELAIFPVFRSRPSDCVALRRQPIVWTISKLIYVYMFQMRAQSFILCKYILTIFAEVKVLQQQNMLNVHHIYTLICEVFKWNYEQHLYTHTFIAMVNRFASLNVPLIIIPCLIWLVSDVC